MHIVSKQRFQSFRCTFFLNNAETNSPGNTSIPKHVVSSPKSSPIVKTTKSRHFRMETIQSLHHRQDLISHRHITKTLRLRVFLLRFIYWVAIGMQTTLAKNARHSQNGSFGVIDDVQCLLTLFDMLPKIANSWHLRFRRTQWS